MQWLIDIVLEAVAAGVKQFTKDGADVNRTFFAAGGEPDIDRGAYLDLYGNEHPAHPGVAALFGEGDIGINTFAPLFTFSIASADGSDQIGFFHDSANANIKWTDGSLFFQSDEGENPDTYLEIVGKGTGRGYLKVYDVGYDEHLYLTCVFGSGLLRVAGSNLARLSLQNTADIPISMFYNATEGEAPALQLSGWHTGDAAKRTLSQGISPDAHNTALWSGVAHYVFDGDLRTTGALISGTKTHSAVGPTDDLDVTGVNVVFLDCSANDITVGGLVGGVNGQVVHFAKTCDSAFNVTLEHIEGTGNQDLHLHAGVDETLTGEYGGWTLVCDGSNWYDISHAKHV